MRHFDNPSETIDVRDATGDDWRIWLDTEFDLGEVDFNTRTWDVRAYGNMRISVGNTEAETSLFILKVQFSLDSNSWEDSGTTIDFADLDDAYEMTANIEVSSVAFVRVITSTAEAASTPCTITAYASKLLGKDVPLSDPVTVKRGDNAESDAFSRLRVSEPLTLFDAKALHDNLPLLFDDVEVSGGSTTSTHSTATASVTLGTTGQVDGKRVRQSFQRMNYQPGKSHMIVITAVIDKSGGGAGITRGVGYYDDDNGVFFEDNGGAYAVVVRSSTSGSAVDDRVGQVNWNIDKMDGTGPSGHTVDFSKAQIFIIDLQWLSVGRVRFGLEIGGLICYVHEFLHSNVETRAYMSTPNLPIRWEIENNGNGSDATIECICAAVISEGGSDDNGILRHISTRGTHVNANTDGTLYAIVGIRLKSTHLDTVIKTVSTTLLETAGGNTLEWILIFNPTVAGTFTYSDVTNSALQMATGATTNTVTGGTHFAGGHFASGNRGGATGNSIETAVRLGSTVSGTPDELVLCCGPVGSSNADIEGALVVREIT